MVTPFKTTIDLHEVALFVNDNLLNYMALWHTLAIGPFIYQSRDNYHAKLPH